MNKLKNLIEESGVKKEKIAEWLGIAPSSLSRKLTANSWSISDVVTLSKKLNLSDEELLKLIKD